MARRKKGRYALIKEKKRTFKWFVLLLFVRLANIFVQKYLQVNPRLMIFPGSQRVAPGHR
jgi:hypothetical protein